MFRHKIIAGFVLGGYLAAAQAADTLPRAIDERLEIVRFAGAPEIVHPISLDFDTRGRLLVIESHTHFRPENYQGPAHDRIRQVEDTDGDGVADRFSTFFEGTKATMDLAVHPDGSVYVATRNEILRLRDANDDGVAEESQRIVFLETTGNYPHNGLAGISFDFDGNLYFGMGENLGASYKLRGSDGGELADEGEGGNIFWCTRDGSRLRRVATGFWNPFGTCYDIFGRLWAVDNDPDASPPCRLVHVVEGGDFGYQFRYGRSGRHPFQSWNGQLIGTLPMVAGTGEAPCEVVSYESDGLPVDYRGQLLVTSWADHRLERYDLKPRGASFAADTKIVIQGSGDFRPVGLAVAPDGSLFMSDWVRRDYNLHSYGALWHIRQKNWQPKPRSADRQAAGLSIDRRTREAAARQMAAGPDRSLLQAALKNDDVRMTATAVAFLPQEAIDEAQLRGVADNAQDFALRALAVRKLAQRGVDVRRYADSDQPAAVQREALERMRPMNDVTRQFLALGCGDPFLHAAALESWKLSEAADKQPNRVGKISWKQEANTFTFGVTIPDALRPLVLQLATSPQQRGLLLIGVRRRDPHNTAALSKFLSDADESVRFLAVKWISDEKLAEQRPWVVEQLARDDLSVRMYVALATALGRIDGTGVDDVKIADHFLSIVKNEAIVPSKRAQALRQVPATHKRLTLQLLTQLLKATDATLQLEAMRAIVDHPEPARAEILWTVIGNESLSDELRATALAGLASDANLEQTEQLLALAEGDNLALRAEALRALTGVVVTPLVRDRLESLSQRVPEISELVDRVLGKISTKARPDYKDVTGWQQLLAGQGDASVGRRLFHHPKLAGCYRCHQIDGRGRDVGPELSGIGRIEAARVLESVLLPNNTIAPHYQVWNLQLADGRTLQGMLHRTQLDQYTYVDLQGKEFQQKTGDIEATTPAAVSLMPTGLVERFTTAELRDLWAYLVSRR